MKRILMAHDLLDSNGKTVKENNMEKIHSIPIGSLVEIDGSGGAEEFNGVRLFVVSHSRDCDGTPLYSLSHEKDSSLESLKRMEQELKELGPNSDMEKALIRANIWLVKGAILNGFPEESLTVIQ